MKSAFSAQVLNKYEIQYFNCLECGFIQTEEPYWLDEAYDESIAKSDTGIVMRNISQAFKLSSLLYLKFDPKAAYLDVAGGYGMLTRLMRDFGFDFYWSDKYSPNLMARGFEQNKSSRNFSAITAFEVMEHVYDPLSFIKENITKHNCNTFIFSTILYKSDNTPEKEWWYYSFDTGQHISFYHKKTLTRIAKILNLNFYSINGIHILSDIHNISHLKTFLISNASPVVALIARKKLGTLTVKDQKTALVEIKRHEAKH